MCSQNGGNLGDNSRNLVVR